MPPTIRTLTVGSRDIPVDTIRTLHNELADVGLPVVGTDAGTTPQFGETTSARVKAFQGRYRLPVTGDVDPATGHILTLSALVATETDRSKLRLALRNAVNAVLNSPDYNYWLARSAIFAGDYGLAASVGPSLRDLSRTRGNLGNIVSIFTPRAPEVPFPENFYSYRYNLMSQQTIRGLLPDGETVFLAPQRSANGDHRTDDPPGDGTVYDPPPPPPPPDTSRGDRLKASAKAWLEAVKSWQLGNAEFEKQRYASAVQAYDHCQRATLTYFSAFPDYNLQAATTDELVFQIVSASQAWADLWGSIIWRRQLLSLAELAEFDWTPIMPWDAVSSLLRGNLAGSDQQQPLPGNPIRPVNRKAEMDARLLVIATVLVPLARGEANRLRRQYAAAIEDFTQVLRRQVPVPNSSPPQTVAALLSCEFIEVPFARLLLIETMLDQAEAQYKARLSVDDERDDPPDNQKTKDLAKLGQIAQDFNSRQIPGDAGNATKPFQHLVAALTYTGALDAVKDDGEYVTRAKQALDGLLASVASTVASGDVRSIAFRSLGKTVTVQTISPVGSSLPGLTDGTHPHEPYLRFNLPPGQQAMRERNPRVYALLLQAQARLLQIWSGFNYLGYRDDYVPPWRFQYLLDRARYFSEHAKNAQRDYLNFLNNAENEENREMSAAQNVELEKANVQIETARVDQAQAEATAAQESASLADLNAKDAQGRFDKYEEYNKMMEGLDVATALGGWLSVASGIAETAAGLPQGPSSIGSGIGQMAAAGKADIQRRLEKQNLKLAIVEAQQAQTVAHAQLEVAKAGLIVAGLQRQASLLRHEFALQTLQFMRNRTLNSEQWYRLAAAIRSVGDTYLRYAIEMAFLAQQAYNFEADKRLNVIRFDYDLSNVGAMLAADFLLRDLDGLEQDLLVGQRVRLQQVRYVLSMAREFPETLRDLADVGEVKFSMRLEQLEKHFPGLVNLRISSVELQPVALMDPTQVSVELTYLGAGMTRLKAEPGSSPLNRTDLAANGDWLQSAGTDWPVKIRVSGPETAVFSGLSRQEAASLSPIGAGERVAFEGLPAASSWSVSMSTRENQVVPGTLADVVITFTFNGYYDPALKSAVTSAASSARPFATTSFISARRMLPDAYYSLVRNGKLDWPLSVRMLSLAGTPEGLRNLAVLLPLARNGVELGRCYCRYPVQIRLTPAASGTVAPLTALPEFTMTPNGLTVNCAFTGPGGTTVTWDFGDGTPLAQGLTVQHVYARPGRYQVLTRLAKDGKLAEYRSAIAVSANHPVVVPLIVTPRISASSSPDGTVALTVSLNQSLTDVSIDCATGGVRGSADSGSATLKLKPGTYVLDFLATRKLSARFYSEQRYLPTVQVRLFRGRVSTNRTFDPTTDANTTTSPNAFTSQLFGDGSVAVSPVDRWTFELPVSENPWFTTVSPADIAEFDASELDDAVMTLEYTVLEGS